MEWIADHLSVLMFLVLTFIMFVGYPVAFVLGGVALAFGALGIVFDVFHPTQFGNLMPRIWGQAVQNQVLIAVPMFVFMGTILEKSGVADDLLKACRCVTRRIPGGLAMSVTVMGTIMAATTGIVGASVIMLTLIALPTMLERGYSKELSVGTIASAGTLGILIPPSIMLVIMGDLHDAVGRHAVHGRDCARTAPGGHLPRLHLHLRCAATRRWRRRSRRPTGRRTPPNFCASSCAVSCRRPS